VSQTAPRPDPQAQQRFRAKGHKYQPGQPLTREDLAELGDGGPWESDEEFADWLADLRRLRKAS
jgi:hypothetical protein